MNSDTYDVSIISHNKRFLRDKESASNYHFLMLILSSDKKNLPLLMDSVAYPDPYVLGLLNPDPLYQGTDSDPDPFIIKQK
jgi:hypothetical protein